MKRLDFNRNYANIEKNLNAVYELLEKGNLSLSDSQSIYESLLSTDELISSLYKQNRRNLKSKAASPVKNSLLLVVKTIITVGAFSLNIPIGIGVLAISLITEIKKRIDGNPDVYFQRKAELDYLQKELNDYNDLYEQSISEKLTSKNSQESQKTDLENEQLYEIPTYISHANQIINEYINGDRVLIKFADPVTIQCIVKILQKDLNSEDEDVLNLLNQATNKVLMEKEVSRNRKKPNC